MGHAGFIDFFYRSLKERNYALGPVFRQAAPSHTHKQTNKKSDADFISDADARPGSVFNLHTDASGVQHSLAQHRSDNACADSAFGAHADASGVQRSLAQHYSDGACAGSV